MKQFINDWVIPIVVAIVLALVINNFFFFIIKVPTESMYPTIKPGDRILVTRIYNTEKLKRGDIVVFKSLELNGEKLIKRLIGLPGDTVDIESNGEVYVNGERINQDYVVQGGGRTGMHFKVPEGKFLFLGDNRGNSEDSRYWKNPYIDSAQIMAKAQFIIFPFNRIGKMK